jgi:hypothetical protein
MIAAWFGVLKNPEPTPTRAIMIVGRSQCESTRRKIPMAIRAHRRQDADRGRCPRPDAIGELTAHGGQADREHRRGQEDEPMNDGEKWSTSWM